jgi:hypothetical protein
MPEQQNPMTDQLIGKLLDQAANMGILMAGLTDGQVGYNEIADEIAASLRGQGLGADVVATISVAFVQCVARVKADIEAAAGVNISARFQ